MATVATKLITADEFARMPDPPDGSKQELVRGEIVTMPPPRFRHGKYQFRIAKILDHFVAPRRLGQVVTETGVITERGPDSVRGPDVSFWSTARLPLDEEPDGYPDVSPDLIVEILSQGKTEQTLQEKIAEYFSCQVRLVWAVNPKARTITVYRPGEEPRILRDADTLSGEDVLPGFTCPLPEIFS